MNHSGFQALIRDLHNACNQAIAKLEAQKYEHLAQVRNATSQIDRLAATRDKLHTMIWAFSDTRELAELADEWDCITGQVDFPNGRE